jgi:hypothetical protein
VAESKSLSLDLGGGEGKERKQEQMVDKTFQLSRHSHAAEKVYPVSKAAPIDPTIVCKTPKTP